MGRLKVPIAGLRKGQLDIVAGLIVSLIEVKGDSAHVQHPNALKSPDQAFPRRVGAGAFKGLAHQLSGDEAFEAGEAKASIWIVDTHQRLISGDDGDPSVPGEGNDLADSDSIGLS